MNHIPKQATVAAVVITRDRPEMLRQAINSLLNSEYPITEIIISDDSSDATTAHMLSSEFPAVQHLNGPHRGRAANRNHAIRAAHSDYILVSDDDVITNKSFVRRALEQNGQSSSKIGMFFAATREHDQLILPKAIDFLGFQTKPYQPGQPYSSANSHCFILTKAASSEVAFDENTSAYGYEEVDFAYRLASAGYKIVLVENSENIHLDPNPQGVDRAEKDASRLYVSFKRIGWVDKRRVAAVFYLFIAIPHHFVAAIKRYGVKGFAVAASNISMAAGMMQKFLRSHSDSSKNL